MALCSRGLLVALLVAAARANDCDVSSKQDCGFVGVTEHECVAKGCCWRPAVHAVAQPSDTPWCFHPASQPALECSLGYQSHAAPFDADEVRQIRDHFLKNIDIDSSGAVVAAPDHNTGPGGDYYFHWQRDGALTMSGFLRVAGWANMSADYIEEKMQHYVQWVTKVQNQPDPNGIDVRTEPKYTIPDGKPFTGAWCRPQNDGPGLRGKTLAEYGMALLARGQADYVKEHLWTGDAGKLHGGLVKYDLDWVAENWQQDGCDLWEEVRSNDFFWNRFVDRASLHIGAEFAEKMGDAATAAAYRKALDAIAATLEHHWDGCFIAQVDRRKDAAVIEAFNTGDLGDGMFGPLTKEVLGTVITLNLLFCTAFDINQKDTAAGVPGVLYGRYEGDTYDGGNPWVLLSASLAHLSYRTARAVLQQHSIDSATYALLRQAYGVQEGLKGRALGDALMGAGDGVLLRVKRHVGAGLHMAEQIDRDNGQMKSAKDLTWNYANVLKAMHARHEYVAIRSSAKSVVV